MLIFCRYVPVATSDYFQGTGYAKIDPKLLQSSSFRVQTIINTRAENALLLYIGNEVRYILPVVELLSVPPSSVVISVVSRLYFYWSWKRCCLAQLRSHFFFAFSQDSYYAISLERGYLVLRYKIDGQVQEPQTSDQKVALTVRAMVKCSKMELIE